MADSEGTIDEIQRLKVLEARCEDLVARLTARLIQEARITGRWGSTRSTADALMALSVCLPAAEFPQLRAAACRSLLASRRGTKDETAGSFDQEVWDTSVALIALRQHFHDDTEYEAAIQEGLTWLDAVWDLGNGTWNQEPWETLWALLALNAAGEHDRDLPAKTLQAMEWLSKLVGGPDQLLINWHYTALFVLVDARMEKSGTIEAEDPGRAAAVHSRARELANRLLTVRPAPGAIWTHEGWSNGLALWALSETGLRPSPDLDERIVSWCEHTVQRAEQGSDLLIEDMAFLCIGLAGRLAALSAQQGLLATHASEDREIEPTLGRAFARVAAVLACEHVGSVQETTARRIKQLGIRDHRPRPPKIEHDYWPGYYTINLKRTRTRAAILVALTVALTLFLRDTGWLEGRAREIVSFCVFAVGVIGAILALAGTGLVELVRGDRTTE